MVETRYFIWDIAASISSISVDALVSRHVLSGIFNVQLCESELLIKLMSAIRLLPA